MKTRTFKDAMMQAKYDYFRVNEPNKCWGSTDHNIYWRAIELGENHKLTKMCKPERSSLSYPVWCAAIDTRSAQR